MTRKVYAIQEYRVNFQIEGFPVALSAHVYIEDAKELTVKEIVDEARGHLKDSGIKAVGGLKHRAKDYEIETLALVDLEKGVKVGDSVTHDDDIYTVVDIVWGNGNRQFVKLNKPCTGATIWFGTIVDGVLTTITDSFN